MKKNSKKTKQIVLDLNLKENNTKDVYERLEKEYNIKIIERKSHLNLVLWKGFLPMIKKGLPWELKQKKGIRYILSIVKTDSIKTALFDDYDTYISFNIFSLSTLILFIICKLRGKRFGVRVGEFIFRKKTFLDRISNKIGKYIVKKSDILLAYTKKSKKFIGEKLKVKNIKIFLTPANANDYSKIKFDNKKLKDKKNKFSKKNKKNILFVGRIAPVKGLDILIRSLRNRKNNVNLIVIGDISNKYGKYCQKLAEKLKIDVEFVGRVGSKKSSTEVIYYYMISDLLILPNKFTPESIEPAEIWGGVVDEAMTFGIPTIVTNATGCADDLIIDSFSGRIIKQNSVDELEKALKDFLAHPKKYKKIGLEGKNSYKKMKNKALEGYSELLDYLGAKRQS